MSGLTDKKLAAERAARRAIMDTAIRVAYEKDEKEAVVPAKTLWSDAPAPSADILVAIAAYYTKNGLATTLTYDHEGNAHFTTKLPAPAPDLPVSEDVEEEKSGAAAAGASSSSEEEDEEGDAPRVYTCTYRKKQGGAPCGAPATPRGRGACCRAHLCVDCKTRMAFPTKRRCFACKDRHDRRERLAALVSTENGKPTDEEAEKEADADK